MSKEELRRTLEDGLNNPGDNGESVVVLEDHHPIISVDISDRVLVGRAPTERMGRKRQKKVVVHEGALAEAREAFLFPFLGDGHMYATLLMHISESRYWKEIEYLVDEHRPDDIATFVRKRFSQDGKRYHWENAHEVVWTKPSHSPHVVLSQREKDTFIFRLLNEFYTTYQSLEDALNPRPTYQGEDSYSLISELTSDSYLHVPKRTKGQVMRISAGATKEYISRGKRRGKNYFYTDLDHEKEKIHYVRSRLQDMEPSCKATLAVASRMFALEYEVGWYRTQVSELEKNLQSEFTYDHDALKNLREQYKQSRGHRGEHGDGTKRIHPKRLKKAIKRLDTLYSFIHKGDHLLHDYGERIRQLKDVEVFKNEKAPRKVIIHTAREHKAPLRNERLEGAVLHLKKMAEARYDEGDMLGGQIVRNALSRLGREYILAHDEGYILLPDVPPPDRIRNIDLSLWQAAYTTLRKIGWDTSMTVLYFDGTEEQVWSSPKQGLHPGMKSIQLRSGILDDISVKVSLERGYGKGLDVVLENVGESIFSDQYNPKVDPVVARKLEHGLLGDAKGYQGDLVLRQRDLSKLLAQFEKGGCHPGLQGHVIMFNGDPSRVELHPDVVADIPVYRCSVYGNLPLVPIGVERKKPSAAEQVDKALYKESNHLFHF